MLDYIYEWIQNISFYLVLITAIIHMMPDSDYKKYIRFFTGLVLILLILTPVLKLFQMDYWVTDIYNSGAYQRQIEEMEEQAEYFESQEAEGQKTERDRQSIEVEEIQIGE